MGFNRNIKKIFMIRRVLSGIFGTVLFGILAPILFVLIDCSPNSFSGFVWIVAAGMVLGAFIGALFPSVFAMIFEIIMGV